MINRALVRWSCAAALVAVTGVLEIGCKKDESPTSPGGGGGLPTYSFGTSGQTFTVPASGGAARAVLTGGTLPYTITSSPNPAVAGASIAHDTLTVTPAAAGSTSITITDSLGSTLDRVVTLGITITGSSGSGYGSGTMTAASSAGNLSFTGTGVWPPAAGPSVLAVYDTLARTLYMLGYQHLSGSHYNFVLMYVVMPSGVATGTYAVGQFSSFQVGYNADTTYTDTTAYTGVSGNVVVSSVTGLNAIGNYSGTASLNGATPIAMSGTLNVTFVNGRAPITSAGDRPSMVGVVRKMLEQNKR